MSFKSNSEDISDENPDAWEEAKRRLKVIRRLDELGSGRSTADVKQAATDLGLSASRIYVLLDRYRQDHRTRSLLPRRAGWQAGASRLTAKQEDIIQTAVDSEIGHSKKPDLKKIMEDVKLACADAKIPCPSSPTIRARFAALKAKQRSKTPRDRKDRPVGDSPHASRPLDRIQLDHTRVDLIVVDEQTRRPIGRPWITLAIDVFSRLVLGFYLSLEHPSTTSVALAIAHAILPKDRWLRERGIKHTWPARGIPDYVIVDNAKEFKASDFRRACDNYGIEIPDRGPRRPTYGAHIERLIGTQMGAVHMLPGTTLSNIQELGDYDPEKAATMTLEEAEKWIALEILGKYHKKKHSGLGFPPEVVWENNLPVSVDNRLAGVDAKVLFIDFLPSKKRTVSREGIVFNYIYYWDDVLNTWLRTDNRSVIVKYFPPDMSVIYLADGDRYWDIGYRDRRRPSASLWEIKEARKRIKREGDAVVNEEAIFLAMREQREIVEAAVRKTKSARRAIERRRTAVKNPYTGPSPNDAPSEETTEEKSQAPGPEHEDSAAPSDGFYVEEW